MPTDLHIIADANIWGCDSAFASLEGFQVQLEILKHHDITASRVKEADILLVRSSTRVNQELLEGSKVRFVGTATIGDDHIDQLYLQGNAISFSSAAGSSTESVVEYMLSGLYFLEQHQKLNMQSDTLGIIGVGRIGGLLQQACQHIGLATLCNDPPRQEKEAATDLQPLSYLLEHADILTLHTPLISSGPYRTTRLIGPEEFAQFKGRGIINAGRGACIDNQALLAWLNANPEHFAILDCWENEPDVLLQLVNHKQLLIATPHIAGHSLDGKAANTLFVYRDLCDYLKLQPAWDIEAQLPAITLDGLQGGLQRQALAHHLYPIEQDHNAMRTAAGQASTFSKWFVNYRHNYPVRRSWRKTLAAHADYDAGIFF